MSSFDLIWSRITRVLSFLSGLGIMVFETGFDNQERPWLYAAAVGMMGLPVAHAAENVLGRLSGIGPQVLPDTTRPPQAQSKESTILPLPGTEGEDEGSSKPR